MSKARRHDGRNRNGRHRRLAASTAEGRLVDLVFRAREFGIVVALLILVAATASTSRAS